MPDTKHVIFTNIIHHYVRSVNPLNSEGKGSELHVIQRTNLEVKGNTQTCLHFAISLPCTCHKVKVVGGINLGLS